MAIFSCFISFYLKGLLRVLEHIQWSNQDNRSRVNLILLMKENNYNICTYFEKKRHISLQCLLNHKSKTNAQNSAYFICYVVEKSSKVFFYSLKTRICTQQSLLFPPKILVKTGKIIYFTPFSTERFLQRHYYLL